MRQTINSIDKAAIALSGALMLLGVVVLGLAEILDGAPFGAAPVTNDAGAIVATPLVDPNIRTGLVILGFLVLLLWGIYRMSLPTRFEVGEATREEVAAD